MQIAVLKIERIEERLIIIGQPFFHSSVCVRVYIYSLLVLHDFTLRTFILSSENGSFVCSSETRQCEQNEYKYFV